MLREEELRDAALLVSEPVKDAARHGGDRIRLLASADDDRLLAEVIDEGGGLERSIRERDFEKVEGWAPRTVDAAASRWGAHEGTTHVWSNLNAADHGLAASRNPGPEGRWRQRRGRKQRRGMRR